MIDFTGETTSQGIADFAMSVCAMSKAQKWELANAVMEDMQRQQEEQISKLEKTLSKHNIELDEL